jgi:hypothetical protein
MRTNPHGSGAILTFKNELIRAAFKPSGEMIVAIGPSTFKWVVRCFVVGQDLVLVLAVRR